MRPSQGLAELVVRAAPRLGMVAGVALVVTMLWAIFGWSWFDVGLWPWLLAAAPVSLVAALRLHHALLHRQNAERSWLEATAAAGAVVRAARLSGASDGHTDLVQAALWTAQARLSPGGVYSRLRELLSDDDLAMLRRADDPFEALLDAVADRCGPHAVAVHTTLDTLRVAVARSQNLALARSPLAEYSDLASLVLVGSLPISLVLMTGWWTVFATVAVGCAFFLLDDLAGQMEDAFGLGGVRADVPKLSRSATEPPAASKTEEST